MANIFRNFWKNVRHILPQAPTAAGDQLREIAKPTLNEAADQANRTLDHAAQHGQKLLADAEERARRLAEDLDKRMDQQREQLLTRTEATCDRISRQFVRRMVISGFAIVGSAGAVAYLVIWACSKL